MEPVTVKSLSFSLLLFATSIGTRGADDGKSSQDALEVARKDLEALSSLQRDTGRRAALPETTFQAPSLFVPTPSASKPAEETKTELETGKSRGWLLDAFEKTDRRAAANLRSASSPDRSSEAPATRKLEGVSNPLSSYLEQWLSPRDKRALGFEKTNEAFGPRGQSSTEAPFGLKNTPETPTLPSDEMTGTVLGNRSNPYLAREDVREDPLFSKALAPLPGRTGAEPSPLLPLLPVQNPYSSNGDGLKKLDEPRVEPALPPPTAPLVDERRYFPQLRKF